MKIPFNNRQGFYFSIPHKDVKGKIPSKFIQVVKHGNNIHCSTPELASVSTIVAAIFFYSNFPPSENEPKEKSSPLTLQVLNSWGSICLSWERNELYKSNTFILINKEIDTAQRSLRSHGECWHCNTAFISKCCHRQK